MKTLRLLTLCCAFAVPALALAASPWDGTWKIDMSKSHFEGQSFTYSKGATAGMWHVKAGNVSFDFGTDGKPYATVDPDDTMVAKMKGDHALSWDNITKGKTISTTDETLSSDGKTLTDHTTGTRPDGSKIDDTTVYTRVDGGSGFMGTWKSTKVKTTQASMYMIATAADGTIKWDIPDYKESVTGKADGMPITITGPTVPSGATLTLRKAGPMQLDYMFKINGKTLAEGKMTIVDGGKAITDVSWNPGAPAEKTTGYYVKQ